ncbi:MAG: hypothetical protein NTW21_28320 [Verrucomicrobia bacterium]|nr:hypothetical protein [Verrucomicrobiota bacterium]
MTNDQVKLLCLAIISGCSVISVGAARPENSGPGGLLLVVSFLWFIVKYTRTQP